MSATWAMSRALSELMQRHGQILAAPALVPLAEARLKTSGADGAAKTVHYQSGEVQWLMPGIQSDENLGDVPYEAILVEFKK